MTMTGSALGQHGPKCILAWTVAVACLGLVAACSGAGEGGKTDGGLPDGAAGSGGRTGSGGGASGGRNGSGGGTASGGATSTGGANATGGASATGGANGGGRGGTSATGGAAGSAAATGGTSGGGEFGFAYRRPGPTDVDWLCTFRQAGVSGHVYARFDQTGTMMAGIATIPVYATALAQLSVGGVISDLANAQYDYGGGHHNDSLRFDHQGKSYKYYHSSFGFGFRACQPMDCISVYAPGATAAEGDGCTSARALPETCVRIKSDGTHDPLTDRFMKCPGDTAASAALGPQ